MLNADQLHEINTNSQSNPQSNSEPQTRIARPERPDQSDRSKLYDDLIETLLGKIRDQDKENARLEERIIELQATVNSLKQTGQITMKKFLELGRYREGVRDAIAACKSGGVILDSLTDSTNAYRESNPDDQIITGINDALHLYTIGFDRGWTGCDEQRNQTSAIQESL